MAGPPTVILGYAEAAMYLRTDPGPNISAMISIHGQREFGIESNILGRLDRTFDDIEPPDPANPTAASQAKRLRRWNAENGRV